VPAVGGGSAGGGTAGGRAAATSAVPVLRGHAGRPAPAPAAAPRRPRATSGPSASSRDSTTSPTAARSSCRPEKEGGTVQPPRAPHRRRAQGVRAHRRDAPGPDVAEDG